MFRRPQHPVPGLGGPPPPGHNGRVTTPKRCLVAGATGYVGGRLVPELLLHGHQVVVLARSPEKLRDVAWVDQVEV
ncbi:MAG: NAD(P)H-binding protein, partial [Propionicimonas sp.]